jgi:PAS domain S-box-containing protein
MSAPVPPDEKERLEALREYAVLDTPPEVLFDDLAMVAARICGTPIALISLIDEGRQWFKANIGLGMVETPREASFCAHTILDNDAVLEVPDVLADPRFAESPLATGEAHVRFYAGAPLVTEDGHALGALCVMDREPRKLSTEQMVGLRSLSRHVMAQLDLQRRSRELVFESADRQIAEDLLRQKFAALTANKAETERLLVLAEKSRRALLSVVEDEKRAAQKLRESEERFRQLAENIHEVLWMIDPGTMRLSYVSPAYEKIWGESCEELYGPPQRWIEAIHQEDRERVLDAGRRGLGEGTFDEEFRIVRPDKTECWISARSFPVTDAAGEVVRIVGLARDITERKRAADALRLFRNLVDQSSDTLEIIDAESAHFLDVNANGPIELGCTREEYLSLRVFDVDPNLNAADWPEWVERIRRSGGASREGYHRRKDGSTFPVEINAKWVHLGRDYIVATIRDITARKEAEARVREQAELLDQVTGHTFSSQLES